MDQLKAKESKYIQVYLYAKVSIRTAHHESGSWKNWVRGVAVCYL